MAAWRIATLVALACLLVTASADAVPPPPPLISNGDFENATLDPWVHYAGAVALTDSTVWTAASGTKSVDIGASGALYQDVATTAGQRYDLSFSYAGNPGCVPGVRHLTVAWNGTLAGQGAGSADFTFDTTGHTSTSMGWQTAHLLVDASSTSTHIVFRNDIDTGCGIAIDKVAMVTATGTLTGTQLTKPWDNVYAGEPLTLTATVLSASSGSTPTGSVQFQIDGNPTGAPVPLSSGQAQITLEDLAPGLYDFTATYTPDSVSFATSSVRQRFGINKAMSVAGLAIDSSPAPLGQDVFVTATITLEHGNVTPTGSVQFADESGNLGDPVPLEADGTAAIALQEGVGDHSIWAYYSGDDNVLGSTGYGTLSVLDPGPLPDSRVATTVAVVSSKNPSPPGEPYTVTATVTPAAPSDAVLDGTITFSIAGVAVGDPLPLDANHSASVTITPPAGTTRQSVRASYSGNANFLRSIGSLSQRIGTPPVPQPTTPAAPPDKQPPAFTVTLTPARLKAALRNGLRVHVECDENCSADVRVTLSARTAKALGIRIRGKSLQVAAGSYDFADRKASDLVLRFTARARKALAKAKRVPLRLTTTAGDLSGNDSVRRQNATLKR